MSVPTIIEEEEILAIDQELNDSFKKIPISQKTIQVWKEAYEKADKCKYTDKQIQDKILSDPDVNYFKEKELINKKIKEYDKAQPSDLVKEMMIDNDIQLEEWMSIPDSIKEYVIQDEA